ncbi:hypothetical protein O988_09557, partial [Pseudogymnoascus sp. VKM F-3808]
GGLEEGEEEDVVVVSGGKEIEVEDEKVEGVVDIDATDLESPEKDSLDISTLAADSRGFSITYLGGTHPDLDAVVRDYIEQCPASGGRIEVMGSGPAGIGSALRSVVAECNDGGKVGRGEEKADVGLYWDDRLFLCFKTLKATTFSFFPYSPPFSTSTTTLTTPSIHPSPSTVLHASSHSSTVPTSTNPVGKSALTLENTGHFSCVNEAECNTFPDSPFGTTTTLYTISAFSGAAAGGVVDAAAAAPGDRSVGSRV